MKSDQRSYPSEDLNTSHISNTQGSQEEMTLHKTFKGLDRLEYVNIDNKSSSRFECSHGHQLVHQNICNGLNLDYGSAHSFVKKINLDLNVPMEECDTNVVKEHDLDDKLNRGVMHEQKTEELLVDMTLGSTDNDLNSGTSSIELRYNIPSANSRLPTDDKRDLEDGLELTLTPPIRPELRINWGNKSPPRLSLSLTSNLSDASCEPVEPESSKCCRQKVARTSQHNSLMSDIGDAKSQQCDISSLVKNSKKLEAELTNSKMDNHQLMSCRTKFTPGRVVKQSLNEVEGKLPNHQLTSCCTESTPIMSKTLDLDYKAAIAVNVHPADNSVMPDNTNIKSGEETSLLMYHASVSVPNIKSGEGTCVPLDPATVSVPNMSCNAENILPHICTHPHREGSSSKSLDIVGPDTCDTKTCTKIETEIHKTVDMSFTLHTDAVFKVLVLNDGMSEDNVEMNCDDGSNIQVDPDENIVPRDESQEHNEQHQYDLGGLSGFKDKIPRENNVPSGEGQEGTDQCQDALKGIRRVDDEITRCASDFVDGDDGRLADLAFQCSMENLCEHEEKGLHGNVPTISISPNDAPLDSLVNGRHIDTKDEEMVAEEERSGHIADNLGSNIYPDKKETHCKTAELHKALATEVLEASFSRRFNKPSHEALNNLGKMGSMIKLKSIKTPSAIAKTSNTSAVMPQLNIRGTNVSVKDPKLSQMDVNDLTNKCIRDKVMNIDDERKFSQTKKESSSSFSSFCQRDSASARTVAAELDGDRFINNRRRRDQLYHQTKRYPKFDGYNNQHRQEGKHNSKYTNPRRVRKQYFDRYSNSQYGTNLNNSRGNHCPSRPMDNQQYHTSRLSPRRQLQVPQKAKPLLGIRDAGYYPHSRDASPNMFIRRVHNNILQEHDEVISVPSEMEDELLHSHSSVQYESAALSPGQQSFSPIERRNVFLSRHGQPPVLKVERNALVTRYDAPPYTHSDLGLPPPGLVLERTSRIAEHPGHLHCVEQFVDRPELHPVNFSGGVKEDTIPYSTHNDCYKPINFLPDDNSFSDRANNRDFRYNDKPKWRGYRGFRNFRPKRRQF
ncbi:hypothetical protein Cni_G23651 [Canna indica]|uniref:Uncharacterized protein n=1 Tax=Canna indica TaxID=4628 RepID=A0AAQ3QJE6_9LILI|nr:hypothetical protein Cni_G23651 [Canna indica]